MIEIRPARELFSVNTALEWHLGSVERELGAAGVRRSYATHRHLLDLSQ
jgi:hypothetical protein